MIRELDDDIGRKIGYALNWAREFSLEETKVESAPEEKKGILALASSLDSMMDPDKIQALIFDTARSSGLQPQAFFKVLYRVLLGLERGPRLGPYIVDNGAEKIAEKLKKAELKRYFEPDNFSQSGSKQRETKPVALVKWRQAS